MAYAQTADSSIDFVENRTAPVASFVAYDQDGDAIRWSLSGRDPDLFTIDGGVLTFKEPPDYENPQSAATGVLLAGRNVYRVTIEAADATHDVVVTVTDVDEVGTASIDRLQPQVDRPLAVSLLDEDEGVAAERWQWARSEDGRTWTDIEGGTSPRRMPAPADVGMYLRATVTYADKFGAGKTASGVSANRVEVKTLSNAAPSFADQDDDEATPYIDITRSVEENAAAGRPVGRPVLASDPDEDILFYELLDTPDLEDVDGEARFTIDSATGQMRIGKMLGADVGEREDEDSTTLSGDLALPEGEDAGVAGNSEYILRVRVSDPSTASTTVNVIVKVIDVNEAPRFAADAPTVLSVGENEDPPVITFGDGDTPVDVGTYAVTDQDINVTGPHLYDDTSYAYSVSGTDHSVFVFDGDGILSFRVGHEVDYEERSLYSITIVARSGEGSRRLTTKLDLTIEVVDGEDLGEVSLSQREPQIGKIVHATASDPDGGVNITRWVWEQSAEITVDDGGTPSAECRDDPGTPGIGVVGGWTPIGGALSSVYTVMEADVGRCLRATATYTDDVENPSGAADEQLTGVTEAPVQRSNPANTAPYFVVQSDRTSRRVVENTEAGHDIGAPVSAHDDDGDLLIYTRGGADAGFFSISRNNGQLKTVAPLDYEARGTYTVEVTATDPSGAADIITVTIRVTNRGEPAQITGASAVDFDENRTDPVASFSAYDPETRSIRWSLGGRDANRFTISRGVLRFNKPPNYEDSLAVLEGAALAERNMYRVTIEASGGTLDMAVMVIDLDEAGAVTIDRPQPQVDRLLSASLWDEDEGVTGEGWQWSRSEDGITWMDIEGATSPRRSPAPDDVGLYLRATVTYADRFGSGKTIWAVSAKRVEPRTLSNAAPSFAEQDEDEATPYIEVVRSVAESAAAGRAIGKPVSASDADEDVLFYELLDTFDLEDDDGHVRFTIDSATGQIRLAEELGADDGEREDEDSRALSGEPALPEGEDAGDADNSEYVLRVRASDPSTASATVNVIVTVSEVNEAPNYHEDAPALLRVRENADPPVITFEDGETPVDANTFAVTDQDSEVTGPDGHDDTTYTYSVSGTDSRFFAFNSSGVLGFKANREPDFEEKSSYSITILASSGEGARKLTVRLDVIIEVVNTHDVGEVLLSQRQPQVGILIVATLSDPDGGVAITRWVWERTVDDGHAPSVQCEDIETDEDWTPIGDASSAVYLPQPADVGRCLRAKVLYTDDLDDTDLEATGVLEVPVRGNKTADPVILPSVNAAPVFPDQDFNTEGDQSDRTSREVVEDTAENTKAGRDIGAPVSANDDDGDLLIYTLGGTDARHFRIVRNSGQLKTRVPLNFEVRNIYTVVVTVTDPLGARDSIVVIINITDADDPAVITSRP